MINFSDYILLEDIRTKFDLNKLFDEINRLGFNNRIDKNQIILRWSKSKHTTGLASITGRKYDKDNKKWVINSPVTISISHMFEFDENTVKSVLAHEMVHADHFIRGEDVKDDDHHGKLFIDDSKMVTKKTGIKISVKHSSKGITLASKTPSKELGYFLHHDSSGYAIALFTPKAYQTFIDTKFEAVKIRNPWMAKAHHGVISTTLGSRFKVKRSVTSFDFFALTDTEALEFIK